MIALEPSTQAVRAPSLSVILIAPNAERRYALAQSLRRLSVAIVAELHEYPNPDGAVRLPIKECDALVVDLDSNPELALSVVETICARNPRLTAIAYSHNQDPDLLLQCMRAGARELLREPLSPDALVDVVLRASARREASEVKQAVGKLSLFWGAKGGVGTSTVAAGFAMALAHETKEKVALVDLDPELGTLSLLLNTTSRFSIADAIHDANRLDWDLLSSLLNEHRSGVHLLAAADQYRDYAFKDQRESVGAVIGLLQEQFPHVVVDVASNRSLPLQTLRSANAIYLVTQMDVPSLRNAHRLIGYLTDQLDHMDRLQVVVNRSGATQTDISIQQAEKTLTVPITWRIPNSFAEASAASNTGASIAGRNTPLSRKIQAMAFKASGKQKTEAPAQSGWKLFR